MGNFACIKIHVLRMIGSLGYYKSNFRGVHIFANVLETRITRKYEQREYIYVYSIRIRSSAHQHLPPTILPIYRLSYHIICIMYYYSTPRDHIQYIPQINAVIAEFDDSLE